MVPIEFPCHQYANDTLPHIGRELGGTNVVKIQDSLDGGVNWEF